MAFDSSFDVDEHTRITAWGVRAERVFGWLESDVLGKPVETIISPNHRDSFLQALKPAIALREKLALREPLRTRALHRDSRRFSVELFLYSRRCLHSYRLRVHVRDLTDREQLQNLLSERIDQRAILNVIEDGYTELDLQGNHQWVNDAYCRIFNRRREEVLDPSYQKISHRPVEVNLRDVFKRVYQTGEPVRALNTKPFRADSARAQFR